MRHQEAFTLALIGRCFKFTSKSIYYLLRKTISGPNGHGPLDYALVTSTSFKVFGAVEVKATDYLQGIAQNTVQCESILTNGRKTVFKIITDSKKWVGKAIKTLVWLINVTEILNEN
ncbi:hypothetical protein C2G38_2219617 [Gigaspora rosea]|uniref:Uncharacterized protein n=1 Tax=Gigaspora rosea TaxID=44941 RepID=A0A397U9N9_9GLOM|nr:hypothetical protein C2G38_2219617 [Gigaspora rosea]